MTQTRVSPSCYGVWAAGKARIAATLRLMLPRRPVYVPYPIAGRVLRHMDPLVAADNRLGSQARPWPAISDKTENPKSEARHRCLGSLRTVGPRSSSPQWVISRRAGSGGAFDVVASTPFSPSMRADCDGCIHRKRRCIGIPRETDMHGGERWHCIGVPVGPWYCYREVRTEHEEQWVPSPFGTSLRITRGERSYACATRSTPPRQRPDLAEGDHPSRGWKNASPIRAILAVTTIHRRLQADTPPHDVARRERRPARRRDKLAARLTAEPPLALESHGMAPPSMVSGRRAA